MPAHKKTGKVAWSSHLAYAVGLIATDGCLYKDGRHISLTSADLDQIENFKRCLGKTNRVGLKSNGTSKIKKYYHVQLGDVVLYNFLLDIGLTPAKSKTINSLKIPDEYFFDFLRGHLDGDGSIKKYQDPICRNSTRLYVCFCSASDNHLHWLQDNINRLLGIKGYIEQRRTLSVKYLTFAKYDSLLLLSRIYDDPRSPLLERKYQIVKDLIA